MEFFTFSEVLSTFSLIPVTFLLILETFSLAFGPLSEAADIFSSETVAGISERAVLPAPALFCV
ncbi:MAG: hypothetical protein ACLVB2_10815, partial [Clostridium fessum]